MVEPHEEIQPDFDSLGTYQNDVNIIQQVYPTALFSQVKELSMLFHTCASNRNSLSPAFPYLSKCDALSADFRSPAVRRYQHLSRLTSSKR
jgi:hypothetical protein